MHSEMFYSSLTTYAFPMNLKYFSSTLFNLLQILTHDYKCQFINIIICIRHEHYRFMHLCKVIDRKYSKSDFHFDKQNNATTT